MMVAAVFAFFFLLAVNVVAASPLPHPLDPLSQKELSSTFAVLKATGHVDEKTRFVFLSLREPAKGTVLKWRRGMPVIRESFAMIKQGNKTFEAIVDVTQPKLVSWREIKGVQPALLVYDELNQLNDILRADPRWQAAMRKRGFKQFDKISCMPFSAGYFGLPEEEGHRLVRAECYDAG